MLIFLKLNHSNRLRMSFFYFLVEWVYSRISQSSNIPLFSTNIN